MYWHGDWTWGPRFLHTITPFLIIPSAELLDSDRRILRKPIFSFLVYLVFFLSLAIQIVSVSVNIHKYFVHLQIDDHVSFSVEGGEGIPEIVEPPSGIYFSWEKSPILAQIKFFQEIGNQVMVYEYNDPPVNASREENKRASLALNVFDFWWVQQWW